jgi:hypothetical protein
MAQTAGAVTKQASMNEHMDFKLAPATRLALKSVLESTKSALSQADVVELAVRENPDAAAKAARGYQWKSLFLPEGTLLRMQYKGEYTTAAPHPALVARALYTPPVTTNSGFCIQDARLALRSW